jgi:hypothetical protein
MSGLLQLRGSEFPPIYHKLHFRHELGEQWVLTYYVINYEIINPKHYTTLRPIPKQEILPLRLSEFPPSTTKSIPFFTTNS